MPEEQLTFTTAADVEGWELTTTGRIRLAAPANVLVAGTYRHPEYKHITLYDMHIGNFVQDLRDTPKIDDQTGQYYYDS